MDHSEEAVCKLVVAGSDGAVDLELSEHALNAVPLLVERPIMLDWQKILQDAPFRFALIAPAQVCLQKAGLNQSSRASSTVLIAGRCRDRPILRLCLHGGFYGFGGSV